MGKQMTMVRTTLILKTQMLSEYASLKLCNKYRDKRFQSSKTVF